MNINIMLLTVLSLWTLAACQNNETSTASENRSVSIIYTDWSEGIAISYLVKSVLEDKLDYDVTIKLEDIEKIYPTVADGEYELFLDGWLPKTHKRYFELYKDQLTNAGVIFDHAVAGLVVPDYAEIESIGELDSYADVIVGIDSGSGVVQNTYEAIKKYGLGIDVHPGKEMAMLEKLDDAYKRRDPIVITGWKPHHMFSKYDLKFLTDQNNIYGIEESICAIANTQALEQDKVLKAFLGRFHLTDRQIASLMSDVLSHPEGEQAGAREWVRKNRLIVSGWTKNLHEFEEKVL